MNRLSLALVLVLTVGVQCGIIEDAWNGMSDAGKRVAFAFLFEFDFSSLAKSAWNGLSSSFKSTAGWIKEKINDAKDFVDGKSESEVKEGATELKSYLKGISDVKDKVYK